MNFENLVELKSDRPIELADLKEILSHLPSVYFFEREAPNNKSNNDNTKNDDTPSGSVTSTTVAKNNDDERIVEIRLDSTMYYLTLVCETGRGKAMLLAFETIQVGNYSFKPTDPACESYYIGSSAASSTTSEFEMIPDEGQVRHDKTMRDFRSCVNKLTESNFDQVSQLYLADHPSIDDVKLLHEMVDFLFEKIMCEKKFVGIYVRLIKNMSHIKTSVDDETKRTITLRDAILTKCQRLFGTDFSQDPIYTSLAHESSHATSLYQAELYSQKAADYLSAKHELYKANIILISELYKSRMLTETIVLGCMDKLSSKADALSIECLWLFFSMIGSMIDKAQNSKRINAYFMKLNKLLANSSGTLMPRIKFIILDTLELPKNNWKTREQIREKLSK